MYAMSDYLNSVAVGVDDACVYGDVFAVLGWRSRRFRWEIARGRVATKLPFGVSAFLNHLMLTRLTGDDYDCYRNNLYDSYCARGNLSDTAMILSMISRVVGCPGEGGGI
jgi:hypothetical protein